jgi:hypothetical protein
MLFCSTLIDENVIVPTLKIVQLLPTRVELLLGFKFTGKTVKHINFTGKIGKNGKKW